MISERTLEREPGQRRDQLERVREAYEAAAERTGRVERRFRIAGHLVVLEFAGEALVPYLTPALSHLATEDSGAPELRIRVFDSESSGVALPFTRDELVELNAGGMPAAQAVEGIHASYQRPDSGLSFLEIRFGEAWYWSISARTTPFWDVAGPLRGIFAWWMASVGKFMVHAGVVGQDGIGLAMPGRGGSGKTTLALTCLHQGWDYVGDDYVLLDVNDATAYSLFCSAKVYAENLHRLPWLAGWAINEERIDKEKGVYLPARIGRGRAVEQLRIGALVLPRIGEENGSCLRRARAAEALASLAPSTLLQLVGSNHNWMRRLATFVGSVDCYALELGRDLGDSYESLGVVLNAVRIR